MMKYVSPICEMDKIETVDIMEESIHKKIPGATFTGPQEAFDVENSGVTDNGDGTYDVSVGIDFDKLGISNT
ncbi:MAG: hypothetical protein IJD42_00965 [Clostridia bacterium]|nr:hypothetical protein [Clostridia bacterium]